mmetsp:Transcript_10377/g.18162  ORF Transcript_10377/g.18162 Transcript_10377/m.18162 type:complete len:109 (+) Transcript_10377:280-606(+)
MMDRDGDHMDRHRDRDTFEAAVPASPPVQLAEFSAVEASRELNLRWQHALAMSSDPSVPDEDKPEVYKNPDKAWGGSGNRNPLLSSFNFLSELKLAVSSTGPSKSPEP